MAKKGFGGGFIPHLGWFYPTTSSCREDVLDDGSFFDKFSTLVCNTLQ